MTTGTLPGSFISPSHVSGLDDVCDETEHALALIRCGESALGCVWMATVCPSALSLECSVLLFRVMQLFLLGCLVLLFSRVCFFLGKKTREDPDCSVMNSES